MSKAYSNSNEKISSYVNELLKPHEPIFEEIITRSEKAGLPQIHVSHEDGLHLEVISRAVNPKSIVEIGTLAGLSAVRLHRGLQTGGRLYTCELSERNAEVARETFRKNNIESEIEILVGPALVTLEHLKSKGPFDLVFIDANKSDYPAYLKWSIENTKIGGTIIADNTFFKDRIIEENLKESEKPMVEGIREYNKIAAADSRLKTTILPTGEGLTISVKIKE